MTISLRLVRELGADLPELGNVQIAQRPAPEGGGHVKRSALAEHKLASCIVASRVGSPYLSRQVVIGVLTFSRNRRLASVQGVSDQGALGSLE